jgi:hypothetical protein
MKNEEYIEARLQPINANNKYHNFLNTSSLDVQQFLVYLNNATIGVINNDKSRTKSQIKTELFLDQIDIIENEEEEIGQGQPIILNLKLDEDKMEEFQEKLNVVYSLINIIAIILQHQNVDIENYNIFDQFSEYSNYKRLFNYALNITNDQKNVVKKFNQYLVYSTPIAFDMCFNYNKLNSLIEAIGQIQFVSDDEDFEQNNIFTQNEHLVYQFITNFNIKPIFQLLDLYFFILLDAVTYDSNLEKDGPGYNAEPTCQKLNLSYINGVPVHKQNEYYLILDNYQFIHLINGNENAVEEYKVALKKIASVVTRGFYDDEDGTKIFSHHQFRQDVKDVLNNQDFKKYEYNDLIFQTQYEKLLNELNLA